MPQDFQINLPDELIAEQLHDAEPAAPKKRKKQDEEAPQNKFIQIRDYLSRHYIFRYNVVSNEIEYKNIDSPEYKILKEEDLVCELYECGYTAFENLLKALLRSSFVIEYDPFLEYFEGIKKSWYVGKRDEIAELLKYVILEDESRRDIFVVHFTKALVRTVACSLGYEFNKQCIVIKGNQNDGKTFLIRHLCPPALREYIKQDFDFQGKDGRLSLAQNFIINLDELDKLSRHDINLIKSVFSLDFIKERKPYGTKPEKMLRRASFFGSTNDAQFLTDTTGNVRWIVFNIKSIKHDHGGKLGYSHNIDIDTLWAQAYHLFKIAQKGGDFKMHLTAEEIAENEKNNALYMVQSVELHLIDKYYRKPNTGEIPQECTATDILEKLMIMTNKNVQLSPIRIGRALQQLGFVGQQKRTADKPYPIHLYQVILINN